MKRALVVGCSDQVWEEVEAAQALCKFDTIYCVKMAGIYWDQGFFWWITLHPEYMEKYKAQREAEGLPPDFKIVAPLATEVGSHGHHPADRRVTYRWPGMNASGSSGLFGVKVALDDGHDRVVCAGIPMLEAAGHFARQRTWPQRNSFIAGWDAAMPHIKNKVRSMSGWTQKTLGAPTPEWLATPREADRNPGEMPKSA